MILQNNLRRILNLAATCAITSMIQPAGAQMRCKWEIQTVVTYKNASNSWATGVIEGISQRNSNPCVYTIEGKTGIAEQNIRVAEPAKAKTPAEWLAAHNKARAVVRSSPLRWSDSLAKSASQYTASLAAGGQGRGCPIGHGAYGQSLPIGLGENILEVMTMDIGANAVVANFVSERDDFDAAANRCRAGKICGHYTQVVSQWTTEAGCAQAKCSDRGSSYYIYVCRYNPAGNVIQQDGSYKNILGK